MARPLLELECPVCKRAQTSKQAKRANPRRLERYYECSSCGAEFTTVEQIARAPLEGVMVMPPATVDNPSPRATPYNPYTIERHLRAILRKVLTEAQRKDLLAGINTSMALRLPDLQRLPAGEGDRTMLPANQVRRVTERVLRDAAQRSEGPVREHYETAHALYLMTGVNRSLREVLEMLVKFYPASITADIPAEVSAPAGQLWHYPDVQWAPNPRFVVKNFRPGDDQLHQVGAMGSDADRAAVRQRRPRVPFQRNRLDASISNALVSGHDNGGHSITQSEMTANIREWVLWELAGQEVVRSSQLSTLTAGVLRRCSPLSFLRWVTLGKELSVGEIYSEGCALLRSPGAPLVFDRSAALSLLPRTTPDIAIP